MGLQQYIVSPPESLAPRIRAGSLPSALGLVGLLVVVLVTSCGRGTAEPSVETMDREAFIATYVDLRSAALTTTALSITPAERDSVLTLHEVSEADLLLFVEVHGRDAVLMQDLWNEVEARIQLVLDPDTVDAERR